MLDDLGVGSFQQSAVLIIGQHTMKSKAKRIEMKSPRKLITPGSFVVI